jgi:hypothetical protein
LDDPERKGRCSIAAETEIPEHDFLAIRGSRYG